MASIRNYIKDNLLTPLKQYPTVIQDTMIEIIIEKLETLYNYTLAFPEIVSPDKSRLDILKIIANQFLFTIRDEANLQEQIDILTNILYVYSKRGSIDTIENMWKYYGGDLPKEVEVIIPSYSTFKYNVSKYSGTHVYQDGKLNRTGVYEIKLTNNTYPIPELKEFLLKELVAAGNEIYFRNAIMSTITSDTAESAYKYLINKDYLLSIQLEVFHSYHGLRLSGGNSSVLSGDYISSIDDILDSIDNSGSVWSGKGNIFIDIVKIYENSVKYKYLVDEYGFIKTNTHITDIILGDIIANREISLSIENELYCTPSDPNLYIVRDLYNDEGEHVRERDYFILGESLLGEINYEVV